MNSVLIFFIAILLSFSAFATEEGVLLNETIKQQVLKKKINECYKILSEKKIEISTYKIRLELEKIRHNRDVKVLELKVDKLISRVYDFAFLAFIGFSFGFYAFRKNRDE